MPRGGQREGSGRRPGIPNKRTAEFRKGIEESGLTPLDYLLKVMRDETEDPARRLDAAKSAAPYVHPRLSSVAVSQDRSNRTLQDMTDAELMALIDECKAAEARAESDRSNGCH